MDKRVGLPPRTEENSVCFTGHRVIPPRDVPLIRARLRGVMESCWREGYRWFICGGALGFDTLAAEEVLLFRQDHPEVGLCLAIPCGDQDRRWKSSDKNRYSLIRQQADEEHVLMPVYEDGCMHLRNRYMVSHSSLCVCCMRQFSGGTGFTVRCALSRGLRVINLCQADTVSAAVLKEIPWSYTFTFLFASENVLTAPSTPFRVVPGKKSKDTYRRSSGKPGSGKRK